jgi:GNAT superfamily N-acetyltransferase
MQHRAVCRLESARVQDAERLLEIRRRAILELAVSAMSAEQAEEWAQRRDIDMMTSRINRNPVWVAHFDDVIVGWVELEGNRVVGLYVDPSCCGRGFGSQLLEAAERAVFQSGVRTITLEASWNAEDFYLHRGYEPLGDRPADAALPMQRTLGPR